MEQIPTVKGLNEYMAKFPGRVSHSKSYRTTTLYANKKILVIGNSASGHDITTQLVRSGNPKLPVYQSRRSRSRWDGENSPADIEWKPIIKEYRASTNNIIFEDDTVLSDVDAIIYCTGYKPSFPFWNTQANGVPIFDYAENRLLNFYQHTFSRTFPHTLGIVGLPRVVTFRSFEYQAVALARLFAGRNAIPLPPILEQDKWEKERLELVRRENRKFHDIQWDNGETMEWFRYLFDLSGLPVLEGLGRYPPLLGKETRWAIEHVRKYPEPGKSKEEEAQEQGDWVMVPAEYAKDSLHFI